MTDAADISPSAPQDPCGQTVHDKAVRDRQLALLGDLAEIGLEVARAIEREARAASPPPAAELALAYARVSRAVRLTLQLQTQVLDGPAAKPTPAPTEASPREVRRDRVVNIVERVAKDGHDDSDEVEELVYEASERLDDEDLYGDLMDHPVSEIVARICKDLGLSPDWKALAEELWARREIESGEAGGPLQRFRPARPPPLAGEGGEDAMANDLAIATNARQRAGWEMVEGARLLSPGVYPRAGLRPDPGATAPPPAGEHAAPHEPAPP